jgi:FlgD Ig-like domain
MIQIRRPLFFLSAVVSLVWPLVAGASTFQEQGDAPPIGGIATNGAGPFLDGIHGSLSDSSDVDVYRINIVNPGAFTAAMVQGSEFDGQLFLFTVAGIGVTHNDDMPPGGRPESRLTGLFVPGPGTYLLAISAYNRDPASAGLLQLWLDDPVNVERAPDGPGLFGAVTQWIGNPSIDDGDYWIVLTGCQPVSPVPQGAVFNEIGDASDITPQATSGSGLMNTIIGSFPDSLDVDMYCITVTNPVTFSARTSGVTFDTQLFLFDASGRGVVHNDDSPVYGTALSRITGQFVTAPATYLLAVSSYNRDPASGASQLIWQDDTNPIERVPDGPGAPLPVNAWMGDGEPLSGYYAITLTGANYCPVVPTPVQEAVLTLTMRSHPNPFNPSVQIDYTIPQTGDVTIRVYDTNGKRVRNLVSRRQSAGEHQAIWDGRDDRGIASGSGVYFVRLAAHGRETTTKIVLLK